MYSILKIFKLLIDNTFNKQVLGQQIDEYGMCLVPFVRFEQKLKLILMQMFIFGTQGLEVVHPFGRHRQLFNEECLLLIQLAVTGHISGYVVFHKGFSPRFVNLITLNRSNQLSQLKNYLFSSSMCMRINTAQCHRPNDCS